jgi:hypothetical protein
MSSSVWKTWPTTAGVSALGQLRIGLLMRADGHLCKKPAPPRAPLTAGGCTLPRPLVPIFRNSSSFCKESCASAA